MDSDKIIFTIIGGVTVLILAFILGSSFLKQPHEISDLDFITGGSSHRIGPENPKLVLVEFSDFQCPSCKLYAPIVESLLQKYPNNLGVIYRHFPLPIHNMSVPAARASEAAAIQGKFWEYASTLFENQPNFSDDELVSYATSLGLDIEQFKNDFKSQGVAEAVNGDYQTATELNLPGTPSFFIISDGKVEQLNLQKQGDLENKVQEILGQPNN
ncbi:hypothetical protein CO058_02415 [candidate division WWE3 bacterium CG_4_9_14_0_2_um_filter_35_11]|uniref:Thioredoxin domain-containing protein n=1 Tax=candidate division WWE3 bacterium CG_4_9_14_0_2_um_filter_35_11 TaxID=1975077 RepID=A0A2M8ELH1_UNCKA|nr:MAG: hypothetical protein COV25_02675 [candidate division WWE3 bacterium CG10_big_fil_rev_8_21_14_0_10_35_32]PJC23589.1 MAG: hypothetical protein CO058_02415 [candidate division WWE3 bacterium CG_4_9_14_0_2_um_filter_35_11]